MNHDSLLINSTTWPTSHATPSSHSATRPNRSTTSWSAGSWNTAACSRCSWSGCDGWIVCGPAIFAARPLGLVLAGCFPSFSQAPSTIIYFSKYPTYCCCFVGNLCCQVFVALRWQHHSDSSTPPSHQSNSSFYSSTTTTAQHSYAFLHFLLLLILLQFLWGHVHCPSTYLTQQFFQQAVRRPAWGWIVDFGARSICWRRFGCWITYK